jgi:hypothetical protein
VAKARAANVSMIKLTQSIYTAVRGDCLRIQAPTKAKVRATRFTVT